jgi:hypothetical protein
LCLRIHVYIQIFFLTRFQFSNSLQIMAFDFIFDSLHFSLVVFNSFISCIPSSCHLCILSLSSPNIKSVDYELNLFSFHLLFNFQNHVFTFAFLKHYTSSCKIEAPPFLHHNSMLNWNSNNLGSKQCLNEHNFSPQHSQIIDSTHNLSTYLMNLVYFILFICRNPSLGLMTKARACKVAGQEKELRSERKCEGMNPHTPKWAPTLGVRVPMDSRMFKKRLQGSKPIGLRKSLYHYKAIEI